MNCLTRFGIIFASFTSVTGGASEGHRYTNELCEASLAEEVSRGIIPKL